MNDNNIKGTNERPGRDGRLLDRVVARNSFCSEIGDCGGANGVERGQPNSKSTYGT